MKKQPTYAFVFKPDDIPLEEIGEIRKQIAEYVRKGYATRLTIANLEDFWIKDDNGEWKY